MEPATTMGLDIAKHKLFDAFGPLDDAVTNPTAFGLSDVTNACAQFTACDPSQYLFWDGIHPTSAADLIITDAIESLVTAVPEPSPVALLGVALVGLGFAYRRPRDGGHWKSKQQRQESKNTVIS